MHDPETFLAEHVELTRRWFLRLGASAAVTGCAPLAAGEQPPAKELVRALEKLEPYFTPPEKFRDVSRGNPLPHSLSEAKKREVGMTRESWNLEVVSDPEHPAKLLETPHTQRQFGARLSCVAQARGEARRPLSQGDDLPQHRLSAGHGPVGRACLSARSVWLAQPKADLRRVFYHGYHNDDAKQLFR